MFIGRKNELHEFNERYKHKSGEFIVLYGRRRIGKTELIKEFIKDKPAIFYTALQVTDAMQIDKFSKHLTDYFERGDYRPNFSDWDSVFGYFADKAKHGEKLILVIDEFPYMVKNNLSIPSIIQKFWDTYLQHLPVMLIISGSSMSFMEEQILGSENPLYGRTTAIMKLNELSFSEAKEFMPNLSLQKQVEYYAIFSGVPHYLKQVQPTKSLRYNIKNAILNPNSILFNEPEFLLKQELREVSNYNAIIESVALGKTNLNDIAMHTGIATTKIPYYIQNLKDLGLIKREFSVTLKTKERAKSKSGLYTLSNDYFRFYYHYIFPYLSEITEGAADIILDDVILKSLPNYVAQSFEKIATNYLRQLNTIGKLNAKYIRFGRYWQKSSEIDIVAYDFDKRYLFGECKWRKQKVGKDVLISLEEKSLSVPCQFRSYVIFSKMEFSEELKNIASNRNDVMLVDYSGNEEQVITK